MQQYIDARERESMPDCQCDPEDDSHVCGACMLEIVCTELADDGETEVVAYCDDVFFGLITTKKDGTPMYYWGDDCMSFENDSQHYIGAICEGFMVELMRMAGIPWWKDEVRAAVNA